MLRIDRLDEIFKQRIRNAFPLPKFKKYFDGGSHILVDGYAICDDKVYLHRIDGPACEINGVISYYIRGSLYTSTNMYCEAAGMDGETQLYWFLKYGESLPMRMEDI